MKNLSNIKVLLTGLGAPGAPGIIKSLKLINERKITIIGVDANLDGAIGKGLVDKSYLVPFADDPTFIEEIKLIVVKEKIDIILPVVTKELFLFSKMKQFFKKMGVEVLVSNYEGLKIANNKYELMKFCQSIDLPVPEFRLATDIKEFIQATHDLGYPDKRVCFKPPLSNGLRGFRIIDDGSNKMDKLINEKPTNIYIGYHEFLQIAKDSDYFPNLLIMEYLPGEEYSVDALGDGQRCIQVIPRRRDKIKMGISFVGTTVKHRKIMDYSSKIIESLKLFGNIGFQFRNDQNGIAKILESNPRVQGTIVLCTASGYNMVYNSIKIALGEIPINYKIVWNTTMIRYWDEIYIKNGHSYKLT